MDRGEKRYEWDFRLPATAAAERLTNPNALKYTPKLNNSHPQKHLEFVNLYRQIQVSQLGKIVIVKNNIFWKKEFAQKINDRKAVTSQTFEKSAEILGQFYLKHGATQLTILREHEREVKVSEHL